jgi:hypothetical protein
MLKARCVGWDIFYAGPLLLVCVCDTCGEVLLLLLGYADAMLDGGDAMRKSARNAHVCVHTPYRSIKVIGRAVISASFC